MSERRRYLLPRGLARLQWNLRDQKGTAHIAVPSGLARVIGPERIFRPELTEEGVLFRYVEGGEPGWDEIVSAARTLGMLRDGSEA